MSLFSDQDWQKLEVALREKKVLDITNNSIFMCRWGISKPTQALKDLLTHTLPLEPGFAIKKIRIEKTELPSLVSKDYRLDYAAKVVVKHKNSKVELILVCMEMMGYVMDDLLERCEAHSSRLVADQLASGMAYNQIARVFYICFSAQNFPLYQHLDEYFHIHRPYREETFDVKLSTYTWINIELDKLPKSVEDLNEGLAREGLLYHLYRADRLTIAEARSLVKKYGVVMERALKQDLNESYLKMARKALQTGVRLEDELKAARAISLEKGMEKGIKKGRKEGRKEGREEEKHKIALKMLASGRSHEDISQFTELSLDEIKNLT